MIPVTATGPLFVHPLVKAKCNYIASFLIMCVCRWQISAQSQLCACTCTCMYLKLSYWSSTGVKKESTGMGGKASGGGLCLQQLKTCTTCHPDNDNDDEWPWTMKSVLMKTSTKILVSMNLCFRETVWTFSYSRSSLHSLVYPQWPLWSTCAS